LAAAIAFRAERVVVSGLALLIAEYTLTVLLGSGGVVTAIVMAALLFLLAELTFMAISVPPRARFEAAAVSVWASATGFVVIGSGAGDALLLFGVSRAPLASQWFIVVGAIAAIGVVGILAALQIGQPRGDGG
jgi:hypothetical protein